MAERRVQVKELDVPSMSSVTPTARPVDTYVKPAKEEFQPSELSQFLSAITPAIKAQADERLKQRLDRERKIQAGVYKNQLNQAYQHSVQVNAGLHQHYQNNKDEYLGYRDDDEGTAADKVLAIRQANIDENISAMEREGVDEIIIQAFKNDMQTANTAFMKDVFLKDKALVHEEEVYGKFGNSLVAVMDNGTDLDSQLIDINELYMSFVDANGGNHRKALDLMWGLAEERSRTQADNGIVEWLKSPMSSPEGQPAQWGVAKRAKQRGVIEARGIAQTKATNSAMTAQLTQESLAANAASAYSTGNMSDLATDRDTVLSNGKTVKHKPEDYIPYIEDAFASEVMEITQLDDYETLGTYGENLKDTMLLEANRKRFKFYSTYNLMPPKLSQSVNNGRTLLTMGDLTDPDNLTKARDMYDQLNMADAYSGGGIISTALKGEDVTRFRHLQVLLNGGFDFQAALGMVQGKIYDGRSITIDNDDMKDALDNNWFPTWSKGARARNIGVITDEVSKLAAAILQTDETASVESAKRTAMELVGKDYQFIKNTDDTVTAVRIESNALNDPVNVEQIENALIEVASDRDSALSAYISEQLGVDLPLEIMGVRTSGYDLYVKSTGNPNQLYVFAKPLGEEQEGTQNILLGTVSIWDFNANRIKGLKDQLLQKHQAAMEAEQLSSATSTTPTLQQGGAAGEDAVTTAVANAATQVGTAMAGDPAFDETVGNIESFEDLQQTLDTIISNSEEAIAKEDGIVVEDVETISTPSAGTANIQPTGNVTDTAVNTLIQQEGFSSTPYDDMGKKSVGYGFQIESLEPDELALIADVNNVTEAEGQAVLRLKAQKAETWWTGEVENFSTLPETTQVAAISMGFQLGLPNLTQEWPKFMDAMKRAGESAQGSLEQFAALSEARFHMLYNEVADGTTRLTKWATQTKDRAFEMADALIADFDMPSLVSTAMADDRTAADFGMVSEDEGTVLNSFVEQDIEDYSFDESANMPPAKATAPETALIGAPYKAIFASAWNRLTGGDVEPISTTDIGQDTLDVIKQAQANAEAQGLNYVDYYHYPATKRGLRPEAFIAVFKDLTGKRLSSDQKKLLEAQVNEVYPNNPIGLAMLAYDLQTDPVLKAVGLVGGFSIQQKDGKKFIDERWNFNNKSTSEGTIYKKARAFMSALPTTPVTEDEGARVYIELD